MWFRSQIPLGIPWESRREERASAKLLVRVWLRRLMAAIVHSFCRRKNKPPVKTEKSLQPKAGHRHQHRTGAGAIGGLKAADAVPFSDGTDRLPEAEALRDPR